MPTIQKKELREYYKLLRAGLDIRSISDTICKRLQNETFYKNAKQILAYHALSQELSLTMLLGDPSKTWYLPKCQDDHSITIHSYHVGEELKPNHYGIFEPVSPAVKQLELDIVFIPALAASSKGERLGYGGGYYDRFISSLNSKCLKVCAIPDELATGALPQEPHDQQIDILITQSKTTYINI